MGNRYDFNNPAKELPEYIVLDTSVVLYIVQPKKYGDTALEKLYDETKAFLRRLENAIDKDKCFAYIPPQVITEAFHRLTLYAIAGSVNPSLNALDEYKRRPELIKQLNVHETLFDFLDRIDAIGIEIIQPEKVIALENEPDLTFESHIIYNMKDYLVFSGDANIIAVAERLDIFNIASVDKDFIRVGKNSNFDIYTAASLRNPK